jgi:hypothetical protein
MDRIVIFPLYWLNNSNQKNLRTREKNFTRPPDFQFSIVKLKKRNDKNFTMRDLAGAKRQREEAARSGKKKRSM